MILIDVGQEGKKIREKIEREEGFTRRNKKEMKQRNSIEIGQEQEISNLKNSLYF